MANKKEKKIKIDIILPNFNSSDSIKETIKSVIGQTFKNWKLIIVDDCSDKKTKTILKKFSKNKKIKIYWLKKNKGAGYCRNYAIKKSKSAYLAFIDSDDIWKKDKLETQLRFMENNNYLFTYTNYETFGKKIKFISPAKEYDFKKFINDTSICTSTMIVKRDILKNIEFTNSEVCEDYFFKCKILKICNAYCLDDFLTKYRIRKNSLQSSSLKNFYWIWKINKKYNKFNFFENFFSLLFISINSLKKYGFKNF
jgi:teichuronic acid biosynthesis glycosyltransferase TuaG